MIIFIENVALKLLKQSRSASINVDIDKKKTLQIASKSIFCPSHFIYSYKCFALENRAFRI